ncbi:MAG: SCP2 sterol-binding domain-containing protein [Gammaproteobacteria bacterium]|nr:SCP2 sterol-binding domain-containing protein [Gammaproteobacteria bacterium]
MLKVAVRGPYTAEQGSAARRLAFKIMRFSASSLAAPLFEKLLARFVNQAFAAPLVRGDLDFLEGRRLAVELEDCGVRWVFTLRSGRLYVLSQQSLAEASIRACTAEFIMLAMRRVDADTLFFQQRLAINGDVALGLALKNFLDALDLDELPWPAKLTLHAGDRLLSDPQRGSG